MRGFIYKIVITENDIYVGSTIDLYMREASHNSRYKSNKDNKLYKTAIEKNIEKLKCELLEEIDFDKLEELKQKEEKYRLKLNANLNDIACYRSEAEVKEYYKEYYEENK